jgi:putative hydrolase of the HAD superfamily
MLRQFWEKIELDQFFDFQCYSDEAGICKPNLLYYDMAHKAASNLWSAKDHKLLPQEVLHIGDNQITDIEGAINYGWKASLVLPEPGSLSSILNQIGQE